MRLKVPFGIAQMGKAFRNEVTTKSFTFRSIEFEQMEMQFFISPNEDMKWFDYWLEERQNFYKKLGVRQNKLRLAEHGPKELAHYAKKAFDIEYEFPFGWQELEGVHHRGNFDLSQHSKHSGKDLTYHDLDTNEKYIPTVIETSAGVDRSILMLLCEAYEEEEEKGEGHKLETRVVLHLHPKIAPITVAIFPLMKKPELLEISEPIAERLREAGIRCQHDVTGSIGKRYRRQDEVGTPFCLTVDYDSIEDGTVTIRDRDSMEQVRLKIDSLPELLKEATKVKESNPRAGVDYQHLSAK
jgi:glycyl-tRNA synthetase